MKAFLSTFSLLLLSLSIAFSQAKVTIQISKPALNFAYNGGPQTFKVTADGKWSISTTPWCDVSPKNGDKGVTEVTVTPSQHLGSKLRNFRMQIAPKNGNIAYCEITQTALQFTLSGSLKYTYESGEQFFTVTSDLPWSLITKSDWLSIEPQNGNAGTTIVVVSARSNTGQNARTGEIKLKCGPKSESTSVSQGAQGLYGSTPDLTVFSNVAVGANATEALVNVIAKDCTWSPKDIPGWITMTPISGSSGARVVKLKIQANPNTIARSAVIRFVGTGFHFEHTESISIKQDGKK